MKKSLSSELVKTATACLVLCTAASAARADLPTVLCHTDQLPTPCASYSSPDATFITSFLAGHVRFRTVNHGDFAGVAPGTRPPTVLGVVQDEFFTGTVRFELSIAQGPFNPVSVDNVPAHTSIELIDITGPTRTFDAELVSLGLIDLGGGRLLRENPVLRSDGITTITDVGGGMYEISSFFDIFMELSPDGGANWFDADGSHPVRIPAPGAAVLAGIGLVAVASTRRRIR